LKVPNFQDNDFTITSVLDQTKLVTFDASTLGPNTQRKYKFGDYSGSFALYDSAQIWTASPTFTGGGGGTPFFFGPSSVVNYTFDGTNAPGLSTTLRVPGNVNGLTLIGKFLSTDVNLTGQAANIGTTNLLTTPNVGMYRVSAYLEGTTAGTGTLTVTTGWTDEVGATTDAGLTFLLTGTGRASRTVLTYVASGSLTYAVSGYLTGVYALRIRAEALE
jgi:hypothetical protein